MIGGVLGLGQVRLVRFLPWKLQHRGDLTSDEAGQFHYGSVRKFEGVVMRLRTVELDLPEASEVAAG